MNQDRPKPNQTASALAAEADRRAREAAALRENLHRRKAQARARDPGGAAADGTARDSAGDPAASTDQNRSPAKDIVES